MAEVKKISFEEEIRTVFSSGNGVFSLQFACLQGLLEGHPHERREVKLLESIVQEGMNIIDIGTNVGISTVTIAGKIGERGRPYSFKAVPKYFGIVEKNLTLNGLGNAKAFKIALTDRIGMMVEVREEGEDSVGAEAWDMVMEEAWTE